MRILPKAVKEQFEEIKLENKARHIYLKELSGRFYVYNMEYLADETGRKVRRSYYMGRITDEGIFLRKGGSGDENKLEAAKVLIKKYGGSVIMPEFRKPEEPVKAEKEIVFEPSEEEKMMLTILSMNGRARFNSIAKALGITPQGAARKIRKLEKKYGIDYLAQMNMNRLGFFGHIAFIKFHDKMPSVEYIKRTFENQPLIQLCALIEGQYDLMLYLLLEADSAKAREQVEELREGLLPEYLATWHIKPVAEVYGFIPVRDLFFDVLSKKVWRRTLENPRPKEDSLLQREFLSLRSFNSGGNKQFQDIDKECSLTKGAARYSYYKMLEKGMLERITINIRNITFSYNGIIFMEREDNRKFGKTRNQLRLDITGGNKNIANSYSVIFDVMDPDGVIFIAPFKKDEAIESKIDDLKSKIEGATFSRIGIITTTLVGTFCNRRFDNQYTIQYQNLVKARAVEPKPYIDYTKM